MNFGTYLEEYNPPTLGVVMCPKDSRSAVVALRFSNHGDFLAVSFNNEYKLTNKVDEAELADKDDPLTTIPG